MSNHFNNYFQAPRKANHDPLLPKFISPGLQLVLRVWPRWKMQKVRETQGRRSIMIPDKTKAKAPDPETLIEVYGLAVSDFFHKIPGYADRVSKAKAALLAEFSRLSALRPAPSTQAPGADKLSRDFARLHGMIDGSRSMSPEAMAERKLDREALRRIEAHCARATPKGTEPPARPHPADHAFVADSVEGESMCGICGWEASNAEG